MKPGTFTQMYIQLVFAVRNRDAVLIKEIRSCVFEYMSGIMTGLKHKSIIINGTSNHVHILFGLYPSIVPFCILVLRSAPEKRTQSNFIQRKSSSFGHQYWINGFFSKINIKLVV